jgi:Leucine-rich repeat (LRR) protein
LTSLTLQDNNFTSLQDLQALTQSCPRLTTLNLGNNKITSTYSETSSTQHDHPFTLPKTTTTLDMSYNDIKTWHPINTLPLILPCLHHLRITQNPIFFTTTAPSSAVAEPPTLLSPSDVYILMIARLPSTLKTLNYTAITEKDRVNAEVYYLSQIAKELSLLLPEEKKRKKDVLKHHPRWKELCQEYGVPSVQSRAIDENNVDPTTLAARLVSCLVYPSTATTTTTTDNTDSNNKQQQQQEENVIMEIPKSTTTYKLHGIIARHLSLPPTCLRLILETGEQERVNMATWNGVEEWDSSDEEEEEEEEETTEKKRKEWKQREEELVGGTRTLGTFVDGREARIRVEMK